MIPFHNMVYVEDKAKVLPEDEVPRDARVLKLSGTELRQRLNEGRLIPDWFTYSEVIQELRRSFPPRHQQGFTVFFTGLSGAGKSTIANVLLIKLLEIGGRPVTLFDGDLVREAFVFRAWFFARTSRPQHPTHRVRRFRDHQEPWHCHLCSHRSIRCHAERGARHDCAVGRIHHGASLDAG